MATKIVRNNKLPKPITKPVSAWEFFTRLKQVMREEPTRVDQGDWLRTGKDAICETCGVYTDELSDFFGNGVLRCARCTVDVANRPAKG
jgi:hypothetical protein